MLSRPVGKAVSCTVSTQSEYSKCSALMYPHARKCITKSSGVLHGWSNNRSSMTSPRPGPPGCLQIGGEMSAITTDFTRHIRESMRPREIRGGALRYARKRRQELRSSRARGNRDATAGTEYNQTLPLRPSSYCKWPVQKIRTG